MESPIEVYLVPAAECRRLVSGVTVEEATRAAEEWNAAEADNGKTMLVAFVDTQGSVAALRKRQRAASVKGGGHV